MGGVRRVVESKAQGETREAYLRSYNRSQEPYCSSTVNCVIDRDDDCVLRLAVQATAVVGDA